MTNTMDMKRTMYFLINNYEKRVEKGHIFVNSSNAF